MTQKTIRNLITTVLADKGDVRINGRRINRNYFDLSNFLNEVLDEALAGAPEDIVGAAFYKALNAALDETSEDLFERGQEDNSL